MNIFCLITTHKHEEESYSKQNIPFTQSAAILYLVTTSDCIVLVDGIRITSVSGVLFKGVEDEENIKRKQITKLERKKRERDERYIYIYILYILYIKTHVCTGE